MEAFTKIKSRTTVTHTLPNDQTIHYGILIIVGKICYQHYQRILTRTEGF